MSIERRIKGLEAVCNAGPCPECGWDGDSSKVEHVVEWQDPDGPIEPEEFCETCGRQLSCTIHMDWGDSGP
jgi:hypothetical protein